MSDPLIPREHLFGNPSRTSALISPDGTRLSWLAPRDGVMNVWVAPVDDLGAARAVTRDTGRGIRAHAWSRNDTHVLYVQDRDGDENWHLYSVEVATDAVRDLTPHDGVQARILGGSWDHPDEVLVGLNARKPQWHDIHRVNVVTGEASLVLEHDRFAALTADDALRIRLGAVQTRSGGMEILRATDTGDWEPWQTFERDEALTSGVLHVVGDRVYLLDARDRDTAALTVHDLRAATSEVIGHDARADVSGVLTHPTSREVQAWSAEFDRVEWRVLDPAIAEDLAVLRRVADGDMDVVSRSRDDRLWVVLYALDAAPPTYYLYDRSARRAQRLFTTRPVLDAAPLAAMHAVVIPARDGRQLVSYVTLPRFADEAGTGRPDAPLPMVLLVHGGPWSRDSFGFDPWHQWLANRGYAVLSVNYRGSTGFGKAFVNAADHEWAAAMHDDLLDAVQWAVDQGVARRDAVAIMGGSYGGYATLVGLTFTPEVFACGVDIVGPSNLETLLASIPPYWEPVFESLAKRVGDPRTPEGVALLRDRSPLHRVDAIRRPLLIGQGANDPRVKQEESDQIAAAMQANGLAVTYALFPDEGHGFARPENNRTFCAVAEAFLARCLGGRFEPLGTELADGSLIVPVGAEHVPGLVEALAARDGAASG